MDITPFRTMELLGAIEARRRDGAPVFRFDLGEPQAPVCERVRQAASRAVLTERQGYTESRGRPALRAALSDWYRREYEVEVDPERIVITMGASAALTLAILAGTARDSVIAMPRPAYPAYRNVVRALGRAPAELDCAVEDHFRFSAAHLDRLVRAPEGVIFSSPANPTGVTLTQAEIDALLARGRELGARMICDEIYQGMAFDQSPVTAASDERAFVVNSFSKLWRMTGWRIGWLVCPPELTARVDALAQHLFLCAPALAQSAALSALEEADDCRAALPVYRQNRDQVLAMLKRVGVRSIAPSQGAFYVYADMGPYTDDTLVFARKLLTEVGVSIAPGVDFDPVGGGRWVRFSTVAAPDVVSEGLSRMEAWLLKMRRGVEY